MVIWNWGLGFFKITNWSYYHQFVIEKKKKKKILNSKSTIDHFITNWWFPLLVLYNLHSLKYIQSTSDNWYTICIHWIMHNIHPGIDTQFPFNKLLSFNIRQLIHNLQWLNDVLPTFMNLCTIYIHWMMHNVYSPIDAQSTFTELCTVYICWFIHNLHSLNYGQSTSNDWYTIYIP